MTGETGYSSRAATLAHIQKVRDEIGLFVTVMLQRGSVHDASKLSAAEKPALDTVIPLLKGVPYGSAEYQALLESIRPALQHHYAQNPHHPEHYGERGMAGMDLFDLVEMVCDWIASAGRNSGDGVKLSYNVELFRIDPQLASILANTLARWGEQTGTAPLTVT
jgi:hypothetical protein